MEHVDSAEVDGWMDHACALYVFVCTIEEYSEKTLSRFNSSSVCTFVHSRFGLVFFVATMPSLKLQKRLAASVLDCGKKKIWLDPNEVNEISMANSRTSAHCAFFCRLSFLGMPNDGYCFVNDV